MVVSPIDGATMPSGAHRGNTGGKKGHSGRRPDAFKQQLEQIRDEKGLDVLRDILGGEITYTLNGVCEHCGEQSTGPAAFEGVMKLVPSPETRLRASAMTMQYTIGLTKTIRLEGIPGLAQSFDLIRSRIRFTLAPELAESLIDSITEDLTSIR
jgi:hypothetical protein